MRRRMIEEAVRLLVFIVCVWCLKQRFEPMTRGQAEPVRLGVIVGSVMVSLLASFVFVRLLRSLMGRGNEP